MKKYLFSYREHMKSVNGGLLDTLETDKYKIIIDDALKWLDKYKVKSHRVIMTAYNIVDLSSAAVMGTAVTTSPTPIKFISRNLATIISRNFANNCCKTLQTKFCWTFFAVRFDLKYDPDLVHKVGLFSHAP
jgi:hypothetical protein